MPRKPSPPRLEKNPYGYWEIRWPEGGQRRDASTGTKDMNEARIMLAHFIVAREQKQKEKAAPKSAAPAPLVVNQALDHYWNERVAPPKSPNAKPAGDEVRSPDAAKYAFLPLRAFFGGMDPATIDAAVVLQYCIGRRNGTIQVERQIPVGDGTLRRELGVLNTAINWCVENKKMLPAQRPIKIKMPKMPDPRPHWWRHEECDLLLEKCGRGTRVERFTLLALRTAGRKKAVETLMWSHVDMANLIVDLADPVLPQTKYKKRGIAPIDPNDRLWTALQEAYARRAEILARIAAGKTVTDEERLATVYVLDHPGDTRKAFSTAVKRAGLKGTPHTCRHSFATLALMAGRTLQDVADIMADDPATVARIYKHAYIPHQRKVIDFWPPQPQA